MKGKGKFKSAQQNAWSKQLERYFLEKEKINEAVRK
jgi:hypothetical protein